MDWNVVATEIETIARSVGLNALDYVPDDLPNTAMYVGEMDIDVNQAFNGRKPDGSRRGTDSGVITLRVLVARSTDKYSIRKMRKYLAGSGDLSLVQAIQDPANQRNPELPWSGIKVVSLRGNRLFNVGADVKFYGTEIDVFVIGPA